MGENFQNSDIFRTNFFIFTVSAHSGPPMSSTPSQVSGGYAMMIVPRESKGHSLLRRLISSVISRRGGGDKSDGAVGTNQGFISVWLRRKKKAKLLYCFEVLGGNLN